MVWKGMPRGTAPRPRLPTASLSSTFQLPNSVITELCIIGWVFNSMVYGDAAALRGKGPR